MRSRIVDHYELHEELGHGGMATVYRATDLRLQREVALKILHEHIAAQAENRERFVREARAAARLKHPNIIQIYGFSDPNDAVGYLATERIQGPTLRAMNALDLHEYPELAACLLYIIARALQHAHEAGIIHRDIKPENIMIDHQGRPRLMDFGLARLLDAHTMTATGSLMGSPAHMAPEIVEGHPYDERVDVFALGTVLYFLCTGRLPFEATNPATLLHKILAGEYTAAGKLNENISTPLDTIIEGMLMREPDDRFANAKEVADALQSYLQQLQINDPETVFQQWWHGRSEFIDTWKPLLIQAIESQAKQAMRKGKDAIPEALDWTNRLLALDPTSVVGNELLLRISAQSRSAAVLARIAFFVAAVALTAIPILSLRNCQQTPAISLNTPNFIVENYDEKIQHTATHLTQQSARETSAHVLEQARHFTGQPTPLPTESVADTRTHIHTLLEESALASRRQAEALTPRPNNRRNTETEPAPATPTPVRPQEMLRVYVTVQPPAAEVFVDGQRRCREGTRCVIEVPAGNYSFMARHPVTGMEARERLNIQHDGTEVRMRVPWKPATLIVEADRDGVVLFNGNRVGRTRQNIEIPIEGLRSSTDGTLRIIPDGDFGTPVERRITLSSGEIRREPVQF